MKKRFFLIELLITFIGIIIFAIASTDVYYKNSIAHKEDTLEVYMNQFDTSYTIDYSGASLFSEKLEGCRITFINLEGVVIADSDVLDVSTLKNHLDRKEVSDALLKGSGTDVRESSSIGKDLIYYCAKVDSQAGVILCRIAIPTSSIFKIFSQSIPTLIIILSFDILLCAIVAFLLVDHILRPVEEIAHDASIGKEVNTKYDELNPLCDILNSRNIEIKEKINVIKENKKISNLVLDNMEHGIVIINKYNKIVLINNAAKNLLKVYAKIDEVIYFMQDTEFKNAILNKKNSIIYKKIDDLNYAFRFSFVEEQTVCLITNVTDIINAQNSKNDFIANVTHEMNTPLTSIRGFAELLVSNVLDEDKINHAANVILEQANRLTLLIKSIINYSSYESNDLPSYDVNLSNVINTTISSLEPLFEEHNIKVTKDVVKDDIISSRNERVQEVVSNLIMNAIKYNKDGGSIDIRLHNEGVFKIFEVKDSGIGIKEEDLEKVFDRFYTVDKSHNKHTSGFGLGLAVVKKICQQAGWKIEVSSTYGEGSTFKIIFN